MSERTVQFTFHPDDLEAENVREFHSEIVGAATGALETMLDPEMDASAHRDADILASCAVSEALKALVIVADLDDDSRKGKDAMSDHEGPTPQLLTTDDVTQALEAGLEREQDRVKELEDSVSKVRERLDRAMYIEEGDDPAILEAALDSVAWRNGSPALDELQHAIGTFLAAALPQGESLND